MAKTPLRALTQYDLKLLQVFQTVVDCNGLSAAEPVLNIGRSSISLYISSLEQRLQLKLCHRSRRGFTLTEQGSIIYGALQQLQQAHRLFSQQVNSLQHSYSGTLRLLLADQLESSRQLVLTKALLKLSEKAPQLQIRLELLPLTQIEQALLKQQADLALMPGYRRIEQLEYLLAFRTPVYLCCAAGHPLFAVNEQELTPEQLCKHQTIHPGMDINPEGRRLLQQLNCTAEAYAFDLRLALILTGRYLGFLPDTLAATYQQSGQLRLLKPTVYQYPFEQYLVYRSDEPQQSKSRLMLQLLMETIDGYKDVIS